MILAHKATVTPRSLAILAGAFNPPTAAHVALANAALEVVDEVLLAIPRAFPHKQFDGATLDQRIAMICEIARSASRLSAGVADGGLFVDIAREAQRLYPGTDEIHLLCGRDAAERILTWDYGEPGFAERMLEEFRLLVAPREGPYEAPESLRRVVRSLPVGGYDDCSSTRLREALASGGDWQRLAPPEIAHIIREIYQG